MTPGRDQVPEEERPARGAPAYRDAASRFDELERGWSRLAAGVLLLAFLVVISAGARASEPGTGTLILQGGDGAVTTAPWLDTHVEVRVSGLVARVEVLQTFQNDRDEWVEARYLFPLPDDASVDRLRLRTADRVIEGEIRERGAARATYEEARSEGQRASLLEQQRPELFTAAVANIPPFESIEVEIGYLQVLRYSQGGFDFRLPLTSTPRYTAAEAGAAAGPRPRHALAAAGSEPRLVRAVLPPEQDYRALASLRVELDAGFALAALDSPHHAIRIRQEATRYAVELADGKVPMDRDFVLSWRPSVGAAPEAAVFTEALDGETYALVLLMPPQQAMDQPPSPREMIFVIDTSGSMHGESLVQAKAALALALERLGPRDRFNLIQFSSVTRRLYDVPVQVTDHTRREALARLDRMDAEGGTDMAPALEAALEGAAPTGHLRQVVFITDGAVESEDTLFALIRERLGEARLFTIGIGPAPNGHFMRKAAQFGRGSFTFIASALEVEGKMAELFAKLEKPAVTGLALEWPAALEVWPDRLPDLYLGEPVIVSARLPAPSGTLTLRGAEAGVPWSRSVSLAGAGEHDGIAALWARRKIEALSDLARSGTGSGLDPQREIVEIGLRHRLVTRYTSLVAVEREPIRPQDLPLQARNVPSLLPAAGTSRPALLTGYPATGTPALLHLLLSFALLVLAAALRLAP